MKLVKKWIEKNKGTFLIIVSIIAALVIQFLFSQYPKEDILIAKWGAGDILTYFSTVVLGWLAIWQNEELKRSNQESESRLELLTRRSNEINILSKVIEYELEKKRSIEAALLLFEQNNNFQLLLPCINPSTKTIDVNIAVEKERILDESYLSLCSLLNIDYDSDSEDSDQFYSKLRDLYRSTKTTISHLKNSNTSLLHEDKTMMESSRQKYIIYKKEYLMAKRKAFEELLNGNINLENIKAIY